jgi:hypothetical protein
MQKRGLVRHFMLAYISILAIILLSFCASAESVHPRLFFYGGDIPAMQQEASTTHKEIFDAAKYYADRDLSLSCYAWDSDCSYCGDAANMVFTRAFAYVITDDPKYLTKAKECLLANSNPGKWPQWDTDDTRDLSLADMLIKNSLAYDWLYNNLTETERSTVQAALQKHATEMYEAADYGNPNWSTWWPRSFIQNHRSTNNAALGLTALALEGDIDNGTDQLFLNQAIEQFHIENYVLSHINEGTWHEGFNYQTAVFSAPLPFYINIERLKGINLLAENYSKNYITWMAYNYLPDSERPAFPVQSVVPDWGWNAAMRHTELRYFASRYNDGHAEWVAQQILEESTRDRYKGYHAPAMVFEFLYYNASVAAKALDDIPVEAYYPDAGIVTWRTGWGDDDIVFGLKSSKYGGIWASSAYFNKDYPFSLEDSNANVGHNHADANTFYIYKGGSDLSSEMPHRQTYGESISWPITSYHNTIVVDGLNQYMFHLQGLQGHDVGGVIENVVTSENFNYLKSDATDMYRYYIGSTGAPGNLFIDEFRRYVVFAKPGYLVIVDRLRSASTRKYEYYAHIGAEEATNANNIAVEGDWVKGTVGTDVLGIKVLQPNPFTYTKSVHSVSGQSNQKAYISISPQSKLANVTFATVLYPTTTSGWASKPAVESLGATEDGAGVRVHYNGIQDHLFRYGMIKGETVIGNYTIIADAASVAKDGSGNIEKMFIVNGTKLYESGVALAQSYDELTFEADYSGTQLNIYGDDITGLTIYAPGIDSVRINGVVADAEKTGDYMSISGPKVSVCGAADADADGKITGQEIFDYLNKWKIGSGSTTIKNVLAAVINWKGVCMG